MKARQSARSVSAAHAIIWAILVLITAVSVGISIWLVLDGDKSCDSVEPSGMQPLEDMEITGARVSVRDRVLSIIKPSGVTALRVALSANIPPNASVSACESASADQICLKVNQDHRITISKTRQLDVGLLCDSVTHAAAWYEFEVKDCMNMSGAHWYGAAQVHTQTWPIETWNMDMKPYVPGDSFQPNQYGGVLERYWLSSAGVAVFIQSDSIPLFVSINSSSDGKLCLMSRFDDSPYRNLNKTNLALTYSVCQASPPTSSFADLHKKVASALWEKPIDIPSEQVIRHPIWSTWAMFKENISQDGALSYADKIRSYNLSISQLEIDDDWTPAYGDMVFNRAKFPDPKALVQTLHGFGIKVTLWVHPFANILSNAFAEGKALGFLLKRASSDSAAVALWWRGVGGVLDVTNPKAVEWFLSKLSNLTGLYGVDSFKFDAGETNWLPDASQGSVPWLSPAAYTTAYADMAFEADRHQRRQEVRVGWRSQRLPIFVRMMDKISTWGYDNGLRTLIPSALTFGLLGYPFVLPDMIGGNAYEGVSPDRELYVRWLQANVLLPSMQFSLAPWSYDEEVTNITQKYLRVRDEYADRLVNLSHNAVLTGEPVVRPLWWIAPNDATAQVVDDEFLLGDDVLVAPVVQQGARSRRVYLPAGRWQSQLTKQTLVGSQWFNCSAQLDELPIFILQS